MLKRNLICAIIVCLLWSSIAGGLEGVAWAYESDEVISNEQALEAFQQLMEQGLDAGLESELSAIEDELSQLQEQSQEVIDNDQQSPLNKPQLDPIPLLTNQQELTFTGTAWPEAYVQLLYTVGDYDYEYYAGEAEASGSGNFTIETRITQEGIYHFYARAFLDDETSEDSDGLTVELDFTPPSGPENVYAETTDDYVEIFWETPTVYDPSVGHHIPDLSVVQYELRKENGEIVVLDSAAYSYKDEGLLPETSYRYELYAVDAAGNYSFGHQIKAVTKHQYFTTIDEGWQNLYSAVISGDDNWIAYRSVSGDDPSIILYNKQTKEKTKIGTTRMHTLDRGIDISDDGRYVLYHQYDYVDDDNRYALKLYDRDTETTTTLLRTNESLDSIAMSGDGKHIVFSTYEDDLAPSNPDLVDVFYMDITDINNPLIQCISYREGTPYEADDSSSPAISSDGNYIVFQSRSKQLAHGEAPIYDSFSRIYLYDVVEQTLKPVQIFDDQQELIVNTPTLSADGSLIAFTAIKGEETRVEEKLVGIYRIADHQSLILHRVPGSSDIGHNKPYIKYHPETSANIYVIQDYTNYSPDSSEAPFLSQFGVMYYTVTNAFGEGEATITRRNLISNHGHNAREGRLNGAGTGAVFRDGSTNLPGMALYYVCLQDCDREQSPITSVNWSVATAATIEGQIKRGRDITVQAKGMTGQQLRALVTYQAISEDGVTSGEDQLTVDMSELAQGGYETTFAVPNGAYEISSIVVTTADRGYERQASDTPITIAGMLSIELDTSQGELLERTDLIIEKAGSEPHVLAVNPLTSRYELDLAAGHQYSVTLQKRDGQVLAQASVELEYGQVQEVPLSPFAINYFAHSSKLLYNRYVEREQTIPLRLLTAADADVEVIVSYTTVSGEDQLRLMLQANDTAIWYEGEFTVPAGATSITSITAHASKELVDTERELSLNYPLNVAGELEVEIGNDVDISGLSLTIRSNSLGIAKNIDISTSQEKYTASGLIPAEDYRFTLFDKMGRNWLENQQEVTVQAGQKSSVTLLPQSPPTIVVHVKDESERPIIHSEIIISDGVRTYKGVSNAEGIVVFEYVDSLVGKRVTISAVKLEGEVIIEQLGLGQTEVELIIAGLEETTLNGIVVDTSGKPIPGAYVSVMAKDQTFTAYTKSNGTFSVTAPIGEAIVSAIYSKLATPGGGQRMTLQPGENEITLELVKAEPAIIDINLYTKFIGGNWVGPHELDWRTAAHSKITSSHQIISRYEPFTVYAHVGDSVNICIEETGSNLPMGCGTAVINEQLRGEVDIRIEEQEYGRVAGEMYPFTGSGYTALYSIDAKGTRKLVAQNKLSPGPFELSIPKESSYELWFYVSGRLVSKRQFDPIRNETLQLGQITENNTPFFNGYAGNEVTASSEEAIPESKVTIRATYRNGMITTAQGAKLWLDIPENAQLIADSVIWNGQPVEPENENDRPFISLGEVAYDTRGTVYYTLQFGQSESTSQYIVVAPELSHERNGKMVQEWLGNVQFRQYGITISAPNFATRREILVNGSAPPNSTVTVYDRNLLLGETQAAPNGKWQLTVEKSGQSPVYMYMLRAEATLGEQRWFSNEITTKVDQSYPEPISFVMEQADGRRISLDPQAGTSRFPYVHAPSLPYHFEVKFNEPDRVKNVRFVVGETSFPATIMPDGSFTANILISKVGAIGLDYDIVETAASLSLYVESEEERMEALPPIFQDAKDIEMEISPKSEDGNKQTGVYRATLPSSKGDVNYQLNAALERTMYTPTTSDLAREQEYGIPAYGMQMDYSFNNGKLSINLNGYIPEAAFQQNGKSLKANKAQLAVWQAIRAVAVKLTAELTAKDVTWMSITNAFSLYDGRGGMGEMLDNLADLLDEVALNCGPDAYKKYKAEIDSLYTKLIVNEVLKGVFALTATITGPATFGVGTVALFIATAAMGKLLDAEAEGQYIKLKNKIEADSKCKTQKKERKPKRNLADPVWIHDPSGYVYEVEPDNVIEGVEATALQWNEASQRWEVWDAEWFGQQNPLYTNSQGRYGWDVPEGKWKVLYEKEGYLPGESWEMTVLPPHFDVNVGLVSTLPPQVTGVYVAEGGEYVDILFNRHVLDASIHPLTVWLNEQESLQAVSGSLSLVNEVQYNGNAVSRVVRFTPDDSLQLGKQYELTVDESVQSYNGIAMLSSYETAVVAASTDEQPPLPVSELNVSVDHSSIVASWKEAFDPDLDSLELHIINADRTSEAKVYAVEKGIRWAMADELEQGASYIVEVHALDASGNRSITRATTLTGFEQNQAVELVSPNAPTDVTATSVSRGIEVSWIDPEDDNIDTLVVSWQKNGDVTWSSDQITSGVGRKVINGLTAGEQYQIRVYAVNRYGALSDAVVISGIAGRSNGSGNGGGNPGSGGEQEQPGGEPTEQPGKLELETLHLEPGGGTYSLLQDQVKLTLPDGALNRDAKFTAQRLGMAGRSGTLKPLSPSYKLTLELVEQLQKRGTITLPYDAALLAEGDIRKLGIYVMNDEGAWSYIGGVANAKSLTVTASLLTSGTYAVMYNDIAFADMTGHWAKNDVEVLAAKGIVSGVTSRSFAPERPITRAEFAKLIVMLLRTMQDDAGITEDRSIAPPPVFSDVAADAWYGEYVQEAAALGLMQGANGKFRPGTAITRQEMMTVIARALGFDPASKLNEEIILAAYRDEDELSDWARKPAAYLIQAGLINGANGKLQPSKLATRAESAALLLRVLEYGSSQHN